MSSTCYIALGANLGDPRLTFQRAVRLLQHDGRMALQDHSALYRTAAVGGPPNQNDYLNAVIAVRTELTPTELLAALLEVEGLCGRERREHWGPRTLDLDLLLCDDCTLQTAGLCLPHPHLHERLFVLAPLMDLAADVVHPRLGLSIRQLHHDAGCKSRQSVTRIEPRGWLS